MRRDKLTVGLIVPESGPSGIFGPSCSASAELALDEINQRGGVLGREVVATTIDGGGDNPRLIAANVARQVNDRSLDALVGWHTSALRREIVRAVGGRLPYVYTAVYEGGESGHGVFMTGEVPERQVLPALDWMSDQAGVHSWVVVGSDYVWPRATLERVMDQLRHAPCVNGRVSIESAHFLPLGTSDFTSTVEIIERSNADGVLILLLGQDAVAFNRAFAERGLCRDVVRLSPLLDENMLLAGGAVAAERLYSVSGFFESLTTGHSLDFGGRYARRFGVSAPPLTSPGESCFEGVCLLAELAAKSGSVEVTDLSAQAESAFDYDSPRGRVRFENRHLAQSVYIAAADGLEFDVIAQVAAP